MRQLTTCLLAAAFLAGCAKNPAPTPTSGPHTYMSGFVNNNAVYWKDRTLVTLEPAFNTTGITLSGSDVYVCGNRGYAYQGATADRGCYWKNGVRVDLSDPPCYANAIAVYGNDVYVVGEALINNNYVAVVWKNGTATTLSTVNHSEANGIAISGTDVYVAGNENGAVYWKNGTKTTLSNDPSSNGRAVSVVGNEVFVAGNTYSQWSHKQAAYWKNGVLTDLFTGNNDETVVDTYANSIGVDGTDVHISGWANAYYAAYWKNGKMKYLNNPATYVNAANNTSNLFLFNNHAYVSLNTGDYWKSDTVFHAGNGYGTGIFVSAQ